jgi:hypothetical protein
MGGACRGTGHDVVLARWARACRETTHWPIRLTTLPQSGRRDGERNCISNIGPNGLSAAAAADRLLWLFAEMRRLHLTGIGLKDEPPVVRPDTIIHRDVALHD